MAIQQRRLVSAGEVKALVWSWGDGYVVYSPNSLGRLALILRGKLLRVHRAGLSLFPYKPQLLRKVIEDGDKYKGLISQNKLSL